MFVAVNFDALAQASDIWIERRQVVFLCWMQDSNLEVSKDTPYLTLTGELWDVFCEYFWENWPRYNGTALYKTWAIVYDCQ